MRTPLRMRTRYRTFHFVYFFTLQLDHSYSLVQNICKSCQENALNSYASIQKNVSSAYKIVENDHSYALNIDELKKEEVITR